MASMALEMFAALVSQPRPGAEISTAFNPSHCHAEPWPPGPAPTNPGTHIREKELNALDHFVKPGNDLRREMTEAKIEVLVQMVGWF
jgi:hypothetical protein